MQIKRFINNGNEKLKDCPKAHPKSREKIIEFMGWLDSVPAGPSREEDFPY